MITLVVTSQWEPEWNTAGVSAGAFAWHVGLPRKDWKETPHLRIVHRRGNG